MHYIRFVIPVLILSLAFVAPTAGTFHQQELPDGEGKQLFMNKCSQCHPLDYATTNRRTRAQWNGVIREMVDMGAIISDEEKTSIVEYLTMTFGKIAVNTAAAEEIEKFLGMSSKDASAIVSYRTEHGPFGSLDDLKNVPDIDAKLLDEKKDWISFN